MIVSQVTPSTLVAALAVTIWSVPAGTLPAERDRASLAGGAIFDISASKREEIGTDFNAGAITQANEPQGLSTSDQEVRSARLSGWIAPWGKIEEELARYEGLVDDWDDAGGVPPSETALNTAKAFFRWTSAMGVKPQRSYASPGGDVGLVWERDDGYADVSFFDDGTVSFYIRSRTGNEEAHSEQRMPISDVPLETWAILMTL
jgi:hypothetical protein